MIELKEVIAAARRSSSGILTAYESADEGEHFYRCRHCGHRVDYREFGHVVITTGPAICR